MMWIGLVVVVVVGVAGFVAGQRRSAGAVRALLADVSALGDGEPAPLDVAGARTRLAEVIGARRRERDEAQHELLDRARGTEQEQRQANDRLRRGAKEAIDDTGAVIRDRLRDVVEQVGAARDAAVATHERVAVTSSAAAVMVRRVRSADESATKLNGSLHQVAGIAGVISEIASQTRMLALNATIEAARAGAAGKGFAVVADEVKNLATTTAQSTEQIAETVTGLESDVLEMGRTLAAIVQDVADIETAMGNLNTIADDQHEIVQRLDRTVDETMASIEDLSEVAERLERRRAYRLSATGTVALQARTGQLKAGLADLSTGGLGCTVPTGTPITVGETVRATFTVGGTRCEAAARVVRRVDRPTDIELGLEFSELPAGTVQLIRSHLDAAGRLS